MIESLGIGFALGWLGSMPVAGAVSVFVFQRGLAGRVRDGLLLTAGAAVAEALWCGVARYGAEQVFTRWPAVAAVAEVVGAVILLALGAYFLRLKNRLPDPERSRPAVSAVREFDLGFTLVAGNISIPVNWLVLITVVVGLGFDPFAGPPGSFSLGVALGIMAWFTVLLLLLDRFRTRFADRTLSRIMQGMGGLLIVTGVAVLGRMLF